MSQHTPRTMSAERETEIRRIGNGQFTGIADGAVLQALREEFAEIDAERAVSAELLEALKIARNRLYIHQSEGAKQIVAMCDAAIAKADPSPSDSQGSH